MLKAMAFWVDFDDLDLPEAIYEHIALYHRLLKDQCFVLVHAKAYLTAEELDRLYSMAQYQKWELLLLEAHFNENVLEPEQHTLFDADLCELRLDKLSKEL